MKYQFFGDIHGETHWKKLIDPDCIQVFLGDYFSPYKLQTYEECRKNFLDIIQLKVEKPETVLLIGNHCEDHWHIMEGYSRQDTIHINEIHNLYENNKDKFQVAFAVRNYLITHAGVSKEWKEKRIPEAIVTPESLAKAINKLWLSGNYNAFDFSHNSDLWDYYGESVQHGPMWIRWNTLCSHNVFKDTPYKQIVGHTVDSDFKYYPNKADWDLICIDCMAYQGKSLILDI